MVHISSPRLDPGFLADTARRGFWIVLLAVASAGFSLVFACATPFAAVATIAARTMTRRDAGLVVLATWLANQAIGYGLLDYPRTADSVAWGGAIGIAALAALAAAKAVGREPLGTGPVFGTAIAFAAAFAAYQLVLLAAALVLPASASAFAPSVLLDVLMVNALALLGLLGLAALAAAAGLGRLSTARTAT
ncbi:hypothetical protein SAMN02745126_04952 [Enhydrobacter aerosaccus]|uniref:Uncharacterized protein n=1 Tax=Enhydrobacter aerosaccus TaxID=225324 RepID=A0A1T4SQ94_9HYPH|nr:hypothetical protein [Enhydrobacter aerosaccus]SKA30362.1 hypothetical protein SAMN02745126_04952 [Enhydrobacter aerosaccus]